VRVPVLTAVTDAVWEADLVAALERRDLGVAVVRRCVDLADLLATAAAGTARAVLLSADLRRLDRDALTRLAVGGVAVVGLVAPGDEDAERRLRQLGVLHVLPADAGAQSISAAVVEAVTATLSDPRPRAGAPADPRLAMPDRPDEPADPATSGPLELAMPLGRLIAVWGPTGAPGRTTVAVGLATELAAAGTEVLLVDADVYGGVIAAVLGLLDEAPGLAAAARMANTGTLDLPALAGLAREVSPRLRVLTGLPRAHRWPELRPAAVETVLDVARRLARLIVVDCGFCLEQDEELAYDTTAPRRNGATLAVLQAADTVLAVGGADPISLHRLLRGLSELRETVPDVVPLVVVNRLRRVVVAGDAQREIRAALERYAGVPDAAFLPQDQSALDAAVATGRTLAEAAPDSPLRAALIELAGMVSGRPQSSPSPSRGWRRRLRTWQPGRIAKSF